MNETRPLCVLKVMTLVNALKVLPLLAVLSTVAAHGQTNAAKATAAEATLAPRPAGGEYFGLYLMGKKVGYLFTGLTVSADGKQFSTVNDIHFKANVGARVSERHMRETRVYENKPKGALLSLLAEQDGDGGNQTLQGTVNAKGFQVIRKRPGQPDQVLMRPVPKENADDADPVRLALLVKKNSEGTTVDSTDLEEYKVTTTLGAPLSKTVGGVNVSLKRTVTISDKEKVPTESLVDDKGRVVEVRFGPTLTALAEASEVAKRLDVVEVFGLTRVVLPKPLPPQAMQVPAQVKLTMTGLDEKFRIDSYRQRFKALDKDRVEVTISAAPPQKKSPRPLFDPNGGVNLKSTLAVESDNADIKALAKKLVGDEKDAYTAAKKISQWVNKNMVKDYGSSSDRATDVLRTMKGDCTEHSLLTVALLRAAGIPSKRVDGVVYMMQEDKVPAFYWHEWVEAYVGEWTQLDPTFNEDVVKVTHFAVGEEANAQITPLIGSLKVVDVN